MAPLKQSCQICILVLRRVCEKLFWFHFQKLSKPNVPENMIRLQAGFTFTLKIWLA